MFLEEVSRSSKRNRDILLGTLNVRSLYRAGSLEERRLRVFENRVLRRVFGPKRDEVTGEWRKLHNEELMICIPYPILCGW